MPSNNTEGHFARLGPKAGQELAGADHNGWPAPRDLRVHDFQNPLRFLITWTRQARKLCALLCATTVRPCGEPAPDPSPQVG